MKHWKFIHLWYAFFLKIWWPFSPVFEIFSGGLCPIWTRATSISVLSNHPGAGRNPCDLSLDDALANDLSPSVSSFGHCSNPSQINKGAASFTLQSLSTSSVRSVFRSTGTFFLSGRHDASHTMHFLLHCKRRALITAFFTVGLGDIPVFWYYHIICWHNLSYRGSKSHSIFSPQDTAHAHNVPNHVSSKL